MEYTHASPCILTSYKSHRKKLQPLKEQCKELQGLLQLFADPSSSGEGYAHLPPVLLRTLGEYEKYVVVVPQLPA